MLTISEISNADIAAKSTRGGIISASYSTFRNNTYSIYLESYNGDLNMNASSIMHNTFMVDAESDILSNFVFKEFMHLYRIPSMKVYHNNFIHEHYETDVNDRGTGVYASQVNSIELAYSNTFNRMQTGAYVTGSTTALFENNTFKNNFQGLNSGANINLTAQNNSFDDALLTPKSNAFQMGVGGSTEPTIYKNTFKHGVTGLALIKGNPGILFQVYKNTFEGFNIYSNILSGHPTAIVSDGNHGSILDNRGAEIKCNDFTNYDYAIAVMGGEIKGEQGTPSSNDDQSPAGNRFFDNTEVMPDARFFVKDNLNAGYEYYHHQTLVTHLSTYLTASHVTDNGGNLSPIHFCFLSRLRLWW